MHHCKTLSGLYMCWFTVKKLLVQFPLHPLHTRLPFSRW